MIGVDCATDPLTGLPVFSLYGHSEASLSPTREMLDLIDVMVFDVQDVGSRYYTFVWTMVLAMRACAKAHKQFIVLDRPNPIGGVHVEGSAIQPGFESFVGLVSCPNRHGMTAGEIARWRHAAEGMDLELAVIARVVVRVQSGLTSREDAGRQDGIEGVREQPGDVHVVSISRAVSGSARP